MVKYTKFNYIKRRPKVGDKVIILKESINEVMGTNISKGDIGTIIEIDKNYNLTPFVVEFDKIVDRDSMIRNDKYTWIFREDEIQAIVW